MKWTRAVGMIPALVVLLALAGCGKKGTQAAGPPPQFAPLVTVARATAHDVPVYLEEIGRSGAFESVTVTPQISGRIIRARFRGWRRTQERPTAVHDRSAALSGATRFGAGATGAKQGGAGLGEYAAENVRKHREYARGFADRLGDKEKHGGGG